MKIYVAGPYSAKTRAKRIANTEEAIAAGYELMCRGHIVFIPHLSHFIEEHALCSGKSPHAQYEFWLRQDYAWLDVCDAVLFLGSSPGADLERERAMDQGKPIFYSLADVPGVDGYVKR